VQFLEDFIDGGEVERLLDCILLTAGPLHALSGAIRPERMVGTASTGIALVPSGFPTATKTNELMVSQGLAQSTEFSSDPQATGEISGGERGSGASGNLNTQNVSIVSRTSRGPGIVPSSLLPTDVSVVLRSPYWIRIFYRKNFAVDMHCSVSNKVWLQPAIQHRGGPAIGGSILCPQFQEVVLKYVEAHNEGMTLAEHPMTAGIGVPVHLREALNTVIKRGYGGGWVPLASLKNVLRGILNYLGVLWLFSQLVDILGSILKGDGESLDYLDFQRPALNFRVR
jgi:mediator of RNA polymerase II transcription subunit 14